MDFSRALIKNVDSKRGGFHDNVLISPCSVNTALLLTSCGSKGPTFLEFKKVLCMPSNMNDAASVLTNKEIIESNHKPKPYITSNSVWINKKYEIHQTFVKGIHQTFGCPVFPADFSSHTVVSKINSWISEKTNGKIKNILEKVGKDEAIFLINTLYFKGDWLRPFDSMTPRKGPFRRLDKTVKEVMFLSQMEWFYHFKNKDIAVARLPFRNETSILIIKPEAEGTEALSSVVDNYLNPESISRILSSGKIAELWLRIPRFTVSYSVSIREPLKQLGLVTTFSPNAQFPYISPTPLAITDVLHAVTFTLNETGVEATAATVIRGCEGAGPDPTPVVPFDVNRPFVFVLLDVDKSTPLFVGIVRDVDPNGAVIPKESK